MKMANGYLELQAGQLPIQLGEGGRIFGLQGPIDQKNLSHPKRDGYLITAQLEGDSGRVAPRAMQVQRLSPSRCHLTFTFEPGPHMVLEAQEMEAYLRLRVVEVSPPDGVQCLFWGPLSTSMEGPLGEYLGILREGGSAIGLMSLGMNTDGQGEGHYRCGQWHPHADGGSFLELETWDWTRDRAQTCFGIQVAAKAVPEAGLTGSAVALYGCREDGVLDTVATIEQAEGLPHPVIAGEWIKRSKEGSRSAWWTDYTEENIDRCLDLAVASGFKWLCRFRTFGNWGHFEPDPNLYPGGFAGFKSCSDKAEARGVHTLFYTLSTFIKEVSVPEPYISPVPDPRLQTVLPETALADAVGTEDSDIRLTGGEGVLDMLVGQHMDVKEKVLRIDDELILYERAESKDGDVILRGCQRGYYRTVPARHAAGQRVARMLFTYWKDFFPGTEEMNAEVGQRVGELARKGNFRQVTLDGHEGCRFTGHGAYSQNVFLDAIYGATRDAGFLYTGSGLGNWSWHAMSYISWGEYDRHKGFRGGMLDYRLWRMIQLRNNYMPRRLGQHYPDRYTTVEDIEWLMALAAGWDAGVELHVVIDDFNQNPQREAIVEKIRLWETARLEDAFTEEQKRDFRQSDRLHTLSRDADGGWQAAFVRRWQHETLAMMPSSSVSIQAIRGGSVAPCSVPFDWTHDPGIYQSAWLSNDMIHGGGSEPAVWEFTPPACNRGERTALEVQKLQIILRLPEAARAPVRNPRVVVNGDPEIQVRIPVVLRPGHYLSTPHDMPMAFVYDQSHNVVEEVAIRDLPRLPGGRLSVALSVEGTTQEGAAPVLNLRTHQHIPLERA